MARAATPAGDEIDDPKMARRLKSRTTLAAPAETTTVAGTPAVTPAIAPTAQAPGAAAPMDSHLVVSISVSVAVVVGLFAAAGERRCRRRGGIRRIARRSPRARAARRRQDADNRRRLSPLLVRAGRCDAIRIDHRQRDQRAVRYPVAGFLSNLAPRPLRPVDAVRVAERPVRHRQRRLLVAESASLGMQSAGPVVTPFAEAFAGGGYMRRFQFDRTVPTAYWQFGVDAGASFFLGDVGYVSVALGYLHPVDGFVRGTSFTSVYVDTWSLKLGSACRRGLGPRGLGLGLLPDSGLVIIFPRPEARGLRPFLKPSPFRGRMFKLRVHSLLGGPMIRAVLPLLAAFLVIPATALAQAPGQPPPLPMAVDIKKVPVGASAEYDMTVGQLPPMKSRMALVARPATPIRWR